MKEGFKLLLLKRNVVEEVKDIFGLEFEELKNFFADVFFSFEKNRASVFFTRRCMLLAKFFLEYLLDEMKDENGPGYEAISIDENAIFPAIRKNSCYNYLLTDKADFQDIHEKVKEVYLVDDICIHGNTLEKMAERLDSYFQEKNWSPTIVTYVYMVSEETIVQEPDKCYKTINRAGWTDLSQKIVNAINVLNIPYVSYIHTWTKEEETKVFNDKLNALKENKKLVVISYELEQYDNKECYYIFEKAFDDRIDENEIRCFRLYYSKLTGTVAFVPFVILTDSISEKVKMQDLAERNTLSFEEEPIQRFLAKKESYYDKNIKDYKYNLRSCLRSYMYGLYFIKKYLNIEEKDLKENYIQDISGCLEWTYGKKIFDLLKDQRLEENEEEYFSAGKPIINADIILERINNEDKIKIAVEEICRKNWQNNECGSLVKSARYDKKRRECLDLQYALSTLTSNMKDCPKEEVYLYKQLICYNLIRLCDMGRMNIASYDNKGGSMLKAGELGYVLTKKQLQEVDLIYSKKNDAVNEMIKIPYYRRLFL